MKTMTDLNQISELYSGLTTKDSECPAYGESYFDRKSLLESKRRRWTITHGAISDARCYLGDREVQVAVERAQLTEAQRQVLEEHAIGRTLNEMGQQRGHSKQSVFSLLRRALNKLRRSFCKSPIYGLTQVYIEEVCRPSGYRIRKNR
jgi:DNA-binding CsgD family transcriptional regulator